MKTKRKILLCFFIFMISNVFAQHKYADMGRIKQSQKYYWSEGVGITQKQAVASAKAEISRNISEHIESIIVDSIGYNEKDGEGKYGQNYFVYTKGYSSVILDDATVIELSPEPNCKVFVYVERDKVRTIFDERRNQIADFVDSGKKSEQRLQIDDALRFYYWALLLATTLPDRVMVDFEGQEGNALALLPQKIRSVLNGLKCHSTEMSENEYGEYLVPLQFTYHGNPVASVRYKYYNGENTSEPVIVKDGIGEAKLLDLPPNGKIDIFYEYRFQDEAEQLFPYVFDDLSPIIIEESKAQCSLSSSSKGGKRKKPATESKAGQITVSPEEINKPSTLSFEQVSDTSPYDDAMKAVENAIRQQKPQLAFSYMNPECYSLFLKLLTQTAKVSLTKQKRYEYISTGNEVLGRFVYVALKVPGGKTFMDKLVFRFSPTDHKIQSFAFGLSDKAESDIFDAAKKWSSISRFTILNFMEDYQTAYALGRKDYIESIFSDSAVIIIGHVLKQVKSKQADAIKLNIEKEQVEFFKLTKKDYLERLERQFKNNKYIHLTFEDNTTALLNTKKIPEGRAFGIQIKQLYNSSNYSDHGYLTLMMRMDLEYPVIVVRYWQPGKEKMIDMDSFFTEENFTL